MKTLLTNKKIHLDYEILETLESGIELYGSETKSVKEKKFSIVGARVVIRGMEAFISSMNISPYQVSNTKKDYDPVRSRRLLLKKKEIMRLSQRENEKGLTILPISVYIKGRNIKLLIGVVRGLKKYDKREIIKKKEEVRRSRRIVRGESLP